MAEGKTIGFGLGVGVLCLKLVLIAARASGPSYAPTYPSYGNSQAFLDNYDRQQQLKEKNDLANEREKLVSHQCRSARLTDLTFEIYWTNPSSRRAGLAMRQILLAQAPPLPVHLRGLDVGLSHRFGPDDERWCADADGSLAERALAAAKTPVAKPLGAGAWVVTSTDDSAATSILMSQLFTTLKVKGELLAFVPGDNLVVFADSASPKAISLAARAVLAQTDRTGDEGCVSEDVLVLRQGDWVKWSGTSPELVQARSAALECQISQTHELLPFFDQLGQLNAAGPVVATNRAFSKGKVQLTIDGQTEQVFATADTVIVNTGSGSFQMPWATFQKQLGGSLRPLELNGSALDGYWIFSGALEMELDHLNGTKISSRSKP